MYRTIITVEKTDCQQTYSVSEVIPDIDLKQVLVPPETMLYMVWNRLCVKIDKRLQFK